MSRGPPPSADASGGRAGAMGTPGHSSTYALGGGSRGSGRSPPGPQPSRFAAGSTGQQLRAAPPSPSSKEALVSADEEPAEPGEGVVPAAPTTSRNGHQRRDRSSPVVGCARRTAHHPGSSSEDDERPPGPLSGAAPRPVPRLVVAGAPRRRGTRRRGRSAAGPSGGRQGGRPRGRSCRETPVRRFTGEVELSAPSRAGSGQYAGGIARRSHRIVRGGDRSSQHGGDWA